MKISYFLPLLAISTIGMGCMNKSKEKAMKKGLDIANLDTTVRPGTDFYQFATGGWQKANPIPDEYSRYGSFDQLAENNHRQINDLVKELGLQSHEKGSVAQKIGDLYTLGMDSTKLNQDGANPVLAQLKEVDAAKTREDIIRLVGNLRKYAGSPFFSLHVEIDEKNSSRYIPQISQSGLGLGDRDYYLQNDARTKSLREGYLKLIEKQFENAGYKPAESRKIAESVLKLETQLATAHFPKEKTRVPELNYHLLNATQLNNSVAAFNWSLLFQSAGINSLKELNVAQVEPLKEVVKIISTASIDELKGYLKWNILNTAAEFLSDKFVNTNFDFYGKQLAGTKVLQPRWKRTVNTINGTLGEEVGQLYVTKYFPGKAKERMLKLVDNLKLSLSERISNLAWMTDATKAKAQDKLNNFIVKIGYPDKWRDCSKLDIKKDSYWANIIRSSEFEYNFMLDKLNKPVDKNEWLMSPQTVNAYYNPTTNEICFPAGILQPPFFFMDSDDAINYGAIGVVIGHEMTHGFDDQGRKYDKEGNMKDWWTLEDAKSFEKRSKVMVDFFSNIVVADDVHANGEFTLGENIADHGGLQVSYNAFLKTEEAKKNEKIDGYTPAQRLFLAYANVWAGNIRKEEILRRTKMDPHSLGKWRVNAALPHIQAWYDAFQITEKDPLFIPVDKRVSIW
ncbi:MAG: Peptidase family [Bacteroidetes bacterium]|nr:Peptidase family [Bacteroidota bacterium]